MDSKVFKILAVLLLLLHGGLALDCVFRDSPVIDELGHVTAGLFYWEFGDFSLYNVNPPLSRLLFTAPLLLDKPRTDFHQARSENPAARREWLVAKDFLDANQYCYFRYFVWCRLVTVLCSCLGGFLVLQWATELYGKTSGILALALWTAEPNVLAWAHIALPDMPAAIFGFMATFAFWKYLGAPSWKLVAIAGLLLGLALLCKFTMFVLYPAWLVMTLMQTFSSSSLSSGAPSIRIRISQLVAQLMCIILASILVINAGYGFEDSFRRLGDFAFVSDALRHDTNGDAGAGAELERSSDRGNQNRYRGTWLQSVRIPLPGNMIKGIDLQKADFEAGFPSFLRGEFRHRGWWYYYLYGLAIKVPLGTIALVITAFVSLLVCCKGVTVAIREWMVITPAIMLVAFVSAQTGFNHHLRYVLPAFPYFMVLASRLATNLGKSNFQPLGRDDQPAKTQVRLRWIRTTWILLCLAYSTISVLRFHPHHLAYFNEAVGGPERGHEHMVDSNVDWGQDLFRLRDWLREHPEARPLGLAYRNLVDPSFEGIEFHLPPRGPTGIFQDNPEYTSRLGPKPGWYAVSVTFIRGFGYMVAAEDHSLQYVPDLAYTYFGHFKPVAKAGYSIFIFHITTDDANCVRSKLGLPRLDAPGENP